MRGEVNVRDKEIEKKIVSGKDIERVRERGREIILRRIERERER
jgi:hypothetical protein